MIVDTRRRRRQPRIGPPHQISAGRLHADHAHRWPRRISARSTSRCRSTRSTTFVDDLDADLFSVSSSPCTRTPRFKDLVATDRRGEGEARHDQLFVRRRWLDAASGGALFCAMAGIEMIHIPLSRGHRADHRSARRAGRRAVRYANGDAAAYRLRRDPQLLGVTSPKSGRR